MTVMACLPTFCEDVGDPGGPLPPDLFVFIEQPPGFLQAFMVAPHNLLPSALLLGHQGSPLQHRHMLLDCGETHGVERSEAGDRKFGNRHPAHDVAAGGIGERLEEAVQFGFSELIYNHLVVRYAFRHPLSMVEIIGRLTAAGTGGTCPAASWT